MSMKAVREYYGVPAKRGMWVEVYYLPLGWGRGGADVWRLAKRGRITSATHSLFIDGGGPYHPRYGVVYFEKEGGAVLLDTREDYAGGE